MSEIIRVTFDGDGCPNKRKLRKAIKVIESYKKLGTSYDQFYDVLKSNYYSEYTRPEQIIFNGKTIDVLAFHTCGWIGNEELISALQKTMIWDLLLIRYDRFGHYYFEVWS